MDGVHVSIRPFSKITKTGAMGAHEGLPVTRPHDHLFKRFKVKTGNNMSRPVTSGHKNMRQGDRATHIDDS
jgi:hypothetical protein